MATNAPCFVLVGGVSFDATRVVGIKPFNEGSYVFLLLASGKTHGMEIAAKVEEVHQALDDAGFAA